MYMYTIAIESSRNYNNSTMATRQVLAVHVTSYTDLNFGFKISEFFSRKYLIITKSSIL